MTETAVSKKQQKKDTFKIEQWAQTQDPFVNQLYKRLRNNQKKIKDITEIEDKIKEGSIQPKAEQLEKISRKDGLKAEMDEVLSYLKVYQESFPDNPAFAKKKAAKAEAAPEVAPVAVPEVPAIDANKIVEDALSFVADTVILSTLHGAEGVELNGSNQSLYEALAYIRSAWTELTNGAGTWSAAKGHFVDVLSRLIFKSATQVGAHTGKSYSDLHHFISTFAASEGQTLFSKERSHAPEEHHTQVATIVDVHFDEVEEEKGEPVEGGEAAEVKEGEQEGEAQKNGEWRGRGRGGRGGYRGGYQFRKHNTDEEGFTVVKDEDTHHSHYPSRRQRGVARGAYRGRGGEPRPPKTERVEGGEQPAAEGETQQHQEGDEGRGERRPFRGDRRGGEFHGERRGGEFRGERRGGEFRGERRSGEFRGGEFRGDRRGGRGGRGGDKPWTEHRPREHRGRGEVRRTDTDWGEAPATTAPVATAAATETTAPQ